MTHEYISPSPYIATTKEPLELFYINMVQQLGQLKVHNKQEMEGENIRIIIILGIDYGMPSLSMVVFPK